MMPDGCSNCGADLPSNVRACPECGACPDTGWADEAQYESTHLPAEDFNYDDFVQREFGEGGRPTGKRLHWLWICVAILLILFFLTLAW